MSYLANMFDITAWLNNNEPVPCETLGVYTYEGTREMHTLILGRDITGISAFE